MSIRIYVEGGAQGSAKAACRRAFRMFFEKVIHSGTFKVIASGTRNNAYEDFRAALKTHPDDYVLLLVDAERPVVTDVWQHLASAEGDRWDRPQTAEDDQAHLMVQVMESWFLADRNAVASYYGQGFLANSLPGTPDVETIRKSDVFKALEHASKNTKTKGRYHKTRHGFDLLELLDPRLVRAGSKHARRLFDVLTGR